jgi:hypothetical protein
LAGSLEAYQEGRSIEPPRGAQASIDICDALDEPLNERDVTMSCDGIVIRSEDGHEICIPLYREIDRWHLPDPGPDPRSRIFTDLVSLVTIYDRVSQLGDKAVKDKLSKAVTDAARGLQLPRGVALGDGLFKTQRTFMAAAES